MAKMKQRRATTTHGSLEWQCPTCNAFHDIDSFDLRILDDDWTRTCQQCKTTCDIDVDISVCATVRAPGNPEDRTLEDECFVQSEHDPDMNPALILLCRGCAAAAEMEFGLRRWPRPTILYLPGTCWACLRDAEVADLADLGGPILWGDAKNVERFLDRQRSEAARG